MTSRTHRICDSNALTTKYTCCICLDVYKEPVTPGVCDHVFCRSCLINSLVRAHTCPMCRKPFKIDGVLTKDTIKFEIQNSSIKCEFCDRLTPLPNISKHQEACSSKSSVQTKNELSMKTSANANRSTFGCPFCNLKNFDHKDLIEHCNQSHAKENQTKVCPICTTMPWGNPNQLSQNIIQHLNLRHKFEYDVFISFEKTEEEMMREALEQSMKSNF